MERLTAALWGGADADFGLLGDYGLCDTLLTSCARRRWLDGVLALIELGADLNAPGDDDLTPLMMSCAWGLVSAAGAEVDLPAQALKLLWAIAVNRGQSRASSAGKPWSRSARTRRRSGVCQVRWRRKKIHTKAKRV